MVHLPSIISANWMLKWSDKTLSLDHELFATTYGFVRMVKPTHMHFHIAMAIALDFLHPSNVKKFIWILTLQQHYVSNCPAPSIYAMETQRKNWHSDGSLLE